MKNTIRILVCLTFVLIIPSIFKVEAAYKFPWSAGYSWQWWSRGGATWHDCFSPPGVCAVDFGTSDSNKQALISEDGIIDSMCTSGSQTRNAYVTHGSQKMWYLHINKNIIEGNIAGGKDVKRGQLIGTVMTGNFGDTCGTGYQGGSTGHIHLSVPNNATINIDGWNLTYPNLYMTNGGQTKYVDDYFPSTNEFLLRNDTITTSKTYSTQGTIRIDGGGAGFVIAPTAGNTVTISTF